MAIRLRKLTNKSTYVRAFNFKHSAIRSFLTFCWLLAPAMAVRFVKKHVFRPADYQTSPEEKRILDTGSPFQIEIHGKTIQGWKWGDGPSILFVHGWNGRGVQFHRFFDLIIQVGYSVVTFDAPAHGESSGHTSSYFEWTDTIRAILNSHHFEIVAMVGHSLGGSAVINALSKEQISMPTALIAPVFRLKEILFRTFTFYGIPEVVYRHAIAEYERRFGYTMQDDNPHRLLPTLDTDILVIHDRQDQAIPFQDSRDMAMNWPNIHIKQTEGLGHRRILTDHDVVTAVVGYLIDQIKISESPTFKFEQSSNSTPPFEKLAGVLN